MKKKRINAVIQILIIEKLSFKDKTYNVIFYEAERMGPIGFKV